MQEQIFIFRPTPISIKKIIFDCNQKVVYSQSIFGKKQIAQFSETLGIYPIQVFVNGISANAQDFALKLKRKPKLNGITIKYGLRVGSKKYEEHIKKFNFINDLIEKEQPLKQTNV